MGVISCLLLLSIPNGAVSSSPCHSFPETAASFSPLEEEDQAGKGKAIEEKLSYQQEKILRSVAKLAANRRFSSGVMSSNLHLTWWRVSKLSMQWDWATRGRGLLQISTLGNSMWLLYAVIGSINYILNFGLYFKKPRCNDVNWVGRSCLVICPLGFMIQMKRRQRSSYDIQLSIFQEKSLTKISNTLIEKSLKTVLCFFH